MALTLQHIVVNTRGGNASVVLRDSERFTHTFELPAASQFQLGNRDKDDSALRQNIVFRCNKELANIFEVLNT